MKTNSELLLDKSLSAVISAIEIYNKLDFQYRDESFVILLINGWELLLKAKILSMHKGKLNSLYIKQPLQGKRKAKLKKTTYAQTKGSRNYKTISIGECIKKLENKIDKQIIMNIESLIEIRDTFIHFNTYRNPISEIINRLGSASLKNYFYITKDWFDRDLSSHNLLILPMTFNYPQQIDLSSLTQIEKKQVEGLIDYLQKNQAIADTHNDSKFQIMVEMKFQYTKSNAIDAISVMNCNSESAIKVNLTDNQIKEKYPLTFKKIREECTKRYSDCKINKTFHNHMKEIKKNDKYSYHREVSLNDPTQGPWWYNGNVYQYLDKIYTKK